MKDRFLVTEGASMAQLVKHLGAYGPETEELIEAGSSSTEEALALLGAMASLGAGAAIGPGRVPASGRDRCARCGRTGTVRVEQLLRAGRRRSKYQMLCEVHR